jgi:hypothetical protein
MSKFLVLALLASVSLFFFFNAKDFALDPPADPPPKVEGILYFRYFSLD